MLTENKLRGTKHIGSILKCNAAVFCGRGKSRLTHRLFSGRRLKITFHGLHCNVVILHCRREVPDHHIQKTHGLNVIPFCRNHPLNFHGILRDSSRLIHTKYIDSGQCFNTFHIMKQNLFVSQPDRTDCKCYACQKIKSFGNHSNDCCNHRCDAGLKSFLLKIKCLHKQNNSNRYDGYSDAFYQFIQGTDHFGLFPFLHRLCFQCQFGNIGVHPHLIQPCMTFSRYNKAS